MAFDDVAKIYASLPSFPEEYLERSIRPREGDLVALKENPRRIGIFWEKDLLDSSKAYV